jgi:TPR repeat protein
MRKKQNLSKLRGTMTHRNCTPFIVTLLAIVGFAVMISHSFLPSAFAADGVASLREKAEQGDSGSQYDLGMVYEQGKGVPQDTAQAVIWFRKAAEKGDADAEFSLGKLYEEGKGVPKDYTQAADWYEKSAERGAQAQAEFRLGKLYGEGKGVPQDYARAASWYNKAAMQGNADAKLALSQIEDRRNHEQHDAKVSMKRDERAPEQQASTPAGSLDMYVRKCEAENNGGDVLCAIKWKLFESQKFSRNNSDGAQVAPTPTDKVLSEKEVISLLIAGMNRADDAALSDLKKVTATIDLNACAQDADANCRNEGNGTGSYKGGPSWYRNRADCIETITQSCKADLRQHQSDIANFKYTSDKYVITVIKTNNYEGNVISYVDFREKGTDIIEHDKVTIQLINKAWVVATSEKLAK